MKAKERLNAIRQIIESVDERCLAADGPVTPTLQEMTQEELSLIFRLANRLDFGSEYTLEMLQAIPPHGTLER